MKIFLTGGTGFVGSHFLREVQKSGHEVVAQCRPGSRPRLQPSQNPLWIERPLDHNFEVELAGCETLVHLASHTPNPPYAPLDECLYWNVYATTRLLQQAARQGVQNVLVAGTCFEYGAAAEGIDFVHPGTEMRPSLSYPISKAAATTVCLGIARSLGLRLKILRIFQVFGEGEAASRFWPSLRKAALAGDNFSMSAGTQIRDFIPVEEVARQFVDALSFTHVEPGKPQVRNIGTGVPQTLIEFAQYWWRAWGATGELQPGQLGLRPGELQRLVADIHSVHIT
ncbi:NAD-dependent epimerase/dehydratase family protein [Orrella marina]|uniref:NAD-dependent epimerase/dehydratase domain-containing protein n=1 Tax=Orrella marina TaxID=2163011 RepID=A0A2R4XGU7_9BURK|nr:NAD(P)-dependent oxidoreductase [Orrella marina]AWB33040.1 hypothetical protein DBV39_04125 [Orrella marina]